MDLPEQTLQDTTVVTTEEKPQSSVAPYYFTEKPVSLREGIPPGTNPFKADWITSLFILVLVIYAIVAAFSKHLFAGILRSLTFRKSSDQVTDIHGIFSWQVTIANLASFINISLFAYFFAQAYDDLIPFSHSGFERWGIILLSFIVFITIRHLVTVVTGSISNAVTPFLEYQHTIYTSYRSIGLALFPVNTAISLLYDPPVDFLLKTGIAILFVVYMSRVIRLLVIFIENRFSIFYFILYLCALEFLPLALLYRVFAG